MIKFGSLFSGIGGLELGLERAGMRVVWQVECDPFATRVLEKHWPNVARYRDVRECGSHNLEQVDLICGGFPCQPHSLAGKRRASADERDLWGEFARIIRELKPRWVVAENVPGLLSSEHGRFFGRVLRDLAACGYDAEWQVLPASAFGAWHRRDRVFIVACTRTTLTEWRIGSASSDTGKTRRGRIDGRGSECDGDESNASNTNSAGREQQRRPITVFPEQFTTERCGIWRAEPAVGRVANGVPRRVDRLKCLGNAVVPQVAEYIGSIVANYDSSMENHHGRCGA